MGQMLGKFLYHKGSSWTECVNHVITGELLLKVTLLFTGMSHMINVPYSSFITILVVCSKKFDMYRSCSPFSLQILKALSQVCLCI